MSTPAENVEPGKQTSAGRGSAATVALGIFLSRIAGLVRDRVFAHYFGNSDAADAFRAAFRIPNFLQNLFGEGVLSASFIPVYARLQAEKRREEASEVAEATFVFLFLITSILVVAGVFAAPWLIDAIAPGFSGEKRLLTIRLVQILFPGAGLLVFSAWCLGILNSHRRFLLSYTAPIIWNAAIIAAFLWKGGQQTQSRLAVTVAVGSVAGSGLQFLVQLPSVLRFLRPLHLPRRLGSEHVHTVVKNFFPVFVSRGVVQISAYIDALLASFLPTGAVAALSYAQTLYSLPVSLFGMSVSAAELPAADRVFRGALGGGVPVPGQRGGGDHLPLRPIHGPRRDLGMGGNGGIGAGLAAFHLGASVFVRVLCATRHAHALEVCHGSRRAGADTRLSVRAAPAASARDRPPLGGGRADAVRRPCGLDRVCPAAPGAASPDRRGALLHD
jgi:hypothetical protein